MAFYLLDRIGFLEQGDYHFEPLSSGEFEAKKRLEAIPDWSWHIEDQLTINRLEVVLGEKPLDKKHKHIPLPVLSPEDTALIVYLDKSVQGTLPRHAQTVLRATDWSFGLLSGKARRG